MCEIAGPCSNSILNFCESAKLVSTVAEPFHLPLLRNWDLSMLLLTLGNCLNRNEITYYCSPDFFFLMSSDIIEHLIDPVV